MKARAHTMLEGKDMQRVVVVEPAGKMLLERPRHRGDNTIRMGLKETGWESVQ
jgi:hypothetical protein